MATDWYERRDELEPGMVFQSCYGVVRLDRRVPGDASQWYVADWVPSTLHPNGSWAYYDSTIEPGDLTGRLPDNYAGDLNLVET
jgi:hypothetical protein